MLVVQQSLCHLFQKRKKNLKKCSICQNSKDKKGDSKLTSTKAERNVITEASKYFKDNLLHELRDADIPNIKYHVNTCYANYRKKKERLELMLQILQHSLRIKEHLTQHAVVQKELRRLAIKSHM